MATAGEVTVKVKPDLSAFREASVDDVVSVINRYAKGLLHSDVQAMAQAVVSTFTVLPR